MYLVKEFKFEAAHRLPEYKGKCANIHGHSWVVRVCVHGRTREDGMVLDFGRIKEICEEEIEKLDHSMMVWVEDEKVLNFCRENGLKVYVMEKVPTVENLAERLFCEWDIKFSAFGVRLSQVIVEETRTSKGVYAVDDEENF